MEAKKTEKADLNNKKGLFFNIGLFVTMCIVVFAFEKRNYEDGPLADLGQISDDFEELLEIPPTEIPPPPPPKIQQPEIIEVPDEEEIEEEIEVDLDVEITEETVIEDIIVEEAPEEEVADEVFTIVEDAAMPPGGYQAFYEYVGKRLKYPAQARRMGIEGKVYVQFVVDKDGSLTEVQAVKGIGAGCDEEAVRVLQSAPKWSPPKQRGKPVKQRIILPITFKLG
ncbi:energy transducer TonB [Fulvivirga sp.]|uniref:energy transducer TonB n=1 Tax=Fulvivirga sp. TaxID=1931237 RepID=UPI0032EE5B2A